MVSGPADSVDDREEEMPPVIPRALTGLSAGTSIRRPPPRDDLFVTALVETIGKQTETITAQGDMIVQLSRENTALAHQLAEPKPKAVAV